MNDTPETPNPEELNQWKIPFSEIERRYEVAMQQLGDVYNKAEREVSSVFFGYYKGWNISKIVKYYSVPLDLAKEVWTKLGFNEQGGEIKMIKTRSKQEVIVRFLKSNVGKVVTPTEVSTNLNISLPTFYNFYNSNRHFFKKVKRGTFEILNPDVERAKSEK
jgi:hypothetical protein